MKQDSINYSTSNKEEHLAAKLLDPGMNLNLRPMRYPEFYDHFVNAIKNTWTVDEVDLFNDLNDLKKLSAAERHLIKRLVAFFATGDTIVSNNLVLNLYKHINSPEARLYLSRQLFEEAVHVQFYLNLLDTYIPDEEERFEAFTSIESIPSIHQKAQFSFKWIESLYEVDTLKTHEDRKNFLMNLICFGGCIEGLFFYGAFAYVYYLRSRGLLNGLASGTNWVFRDESMHMAFAFMVIKRIREEDPTLFDVNMQERIKVMLKEAVDSEIQFAHDLLKDGVSGLSIKDMSNYIKYVADKRLEHFGIKPIYNTKNPLKFMELQDIQELSNFFERKVSAYQLGVTGEVNLNEDF